jgi:hypothetical protein
MNYLRLIRCFRIERTAIVSQTVPASIIRECILLQLFLKVPNIRWGNTLLPRLLKEKFFFT